MRTKNSNREVFRKWRKLYSWGSGRMSSLMKKMVTKTRQEWKIETTIIIIIIAARVVKILLTSVNITWQSFLSWYFFSRCSSHFYDGSQGIKTYTNDNSNRTILRETWIFESEDEEEGDEIQQELQSSSRSKGPPSSLATEPMNLTNDIEWRKSHAFSSWVEWERLTEWKAGILYETIETGERKMKWKADSREKLQQQENET